MEYGPAPGDPREALVWLDQHARKLGHFIGGSFRPPAEGVYFDTLDPSTGERLAAVAQGSAADIDAAVKAAQRAPLARRVALPPARGRLLYPFGRHMQKQLRSLAGPRAEWHRQH